MSTFTDTLAEITTRNAYALCADADTSTPDNDDSTGAAFLAGVRDAVIEHFDGLTEDPRNVLDSLTDGDAAHEIADSAVPVYTYQRWQTFTDLGAWDEDVSEYAEGGDLTSAAAAALYMIATRLVRSLADELSTALDEDDEDDAAEDDPGTIAAANGIVADAMRAAGDL